MSCSVDYSFRRQYPDTLDAIFISKSGDTIVNTLEGMIAEIQKQGETSIAPIMREFTSVTDLTNLYNAQKVFIEKITFFAYDVKELNAPDQTNTTYNSIISSRTSDLIIPQSNYLRAVMPVGFQPNHFRPKVFANSSPILSHETSPIALNSIGYSMPHCFELNKELGKVKKFDIISSFAQRIEEAVYLNYFMTAEITFWLGYGNNDF